MTFDDGKTLRLSLEDDRDGLAPELAELHSDGPWIFGPEFFDARWMPNCFR